MSINLCKCVIRIRDGLAGWRKFLLFLIRPTQVLKHTKAIEQFYFNPSRFVIILPKLVQSLFSCNSGPALVKVPGLASVCSLFYPDRVSSFVSVSRYCC